MLKKIFRIDERLNLGYDVIVNMLKSVNLTRDPRILDVGCDKGQLLNKIYTELQLSQNSKLMGLDLRKCEENEFDIKALDFEKDQFPYEENRFDIVICNQVLEHLLSYMWTLAEIIRVTRLGGYFIVGVPNLASAHNRLLLLLGKQPTSIHLTGPHVRGFTPKATKNLLEQGHAMSVIDFRGSNFYPFPSSVGTKLANLFPSFAVSSFFLVRKNRDIDFLKCGKSRRLPLHFTWGIK